MARILIVDDDQRITLILKQLLRIKGHEGVPAESGAIALDLMKQGAFDVVITDLRMPHMNGLEFLREAKALKPSMPVILVTAYASNETAVESIKLGVFDYVSKPFKFDDLLATIERALMADKDKSRATDGYTGNNPAIKEYLESDDQK